MNAVWMDDKAIAMLKESFHRYDTNRDESIVATEFIPVRRSRHNHLTEAMLQSDFKMIDTNGDGAIHFPEHSVWLLANASHAADGDSDGSASATELRHYVADLNNRLTRIKLLETARVGDPNGGE